VCDWEYIWTLYDNGHILLNEDKDGNLSIILFPFEEFTSYYLQNIEELKDSFSKRVNVEKFIKETIEKLLSNNVVNALVFPIPDGFGLSIPLCKLKEDLKQELENYK